MAATPVPPALQAVINHAAARYGVPADVLAGIWREESGSTFPNPAVNKSGYGGLFGTKNWNAPALAQANEAASVLAEGLRRSGGNIGEALSYFNSGKLSGGYTSVPGETTFGRYSGHGGVLSGEQSLPQAPNARIPSTSAISNADFSMLLTLMQGGSPSEGQMLGMLSESVPKSGVEPTQPQLSPAPTAPMKTGGFVNPVAGAPFARVDQGTDWIPKTPVRALGGGVIESISKGMDGGTGDIIKERLDHPVTVNGHTYDQIYYSEETPLVRQGEHVAPGQNVMAAGGDEIGFLNPDGSFPPLIGGVGAGTQATRQGQDFLAFLRELSKRRR